MNAPSPVKASPTKIRGYGVEADGESYRLFVRHRPTPVLGAGEVLLRVEAVSLNYRDLLVARSQYKATRQGVQPTSDAAGVVAAVGEGVTRWSPGDRAMPGFFRNWADGRFRAEYHASAFGGGDTDGMLAEYVVVPQAVLVATPNALTPEQAATLPCAGVTAWNALFTRANFRPGDTVLVLGTGGVALFGLQLATAAGGKVIVTSSSDEKLARARDLGAWETVNYKTHPEWEAEVLRLTGGQGAMHILETGGQGTFERSLKAVSAAGSIAQIGGLAGFGPQTNTMRLQLINADINGINVGSAEHLAALAAFLTEHRIAPVVDKVFAFDDARRRL